MASKLPWFKFYAQDFLIDNRVLRLSNEQRGVYLWLLCRQWVDGSLPFDVVDVYHLLPPGSESAAVAYVLTEFFPPDPDTNERRNPRLQAERDKAEGEHQLKAETLKAARAAKSLRHNNLSDDSPDVRGRIRSQNQNQIKEEQRSSTSLKDAIAHWKKTRG